MMELFDVNAMASTVFSFALEFVIGAVAVWIASIYNRFTGRQMSDANQAKIQAALTRFAETVVSSDSPMSDLRLEGLRWIKAQYGETLAAETNKPGMDDGVLGNAIESLIRGARKRKGLS